MRALSLLAAVSLGCLHSVPASGIVITDLRTDDLPRWHGGLPLETLGWAVAACDLDGDGAQDMVFTSAAAGPFGRDHAGEAYIVWGGLPRFPDTTFLEANSNHDLFIAGSVTDGEVGYAVAVGDVNGDGRQDLLLGERGGLGPMGQAAAGRAWLVWGDSRAALGDTIDLAAPDARVLSLVGVDAGDMAGYNVGMLDWNDDGRSDLLVCAPYANGPGNGRATAGEVRVVYGKDRALLGTSLTLGTQSDVVIYGPSTDVEAGQSVGGGDLDGDGADDLFVGVPRAPGLSGEFEAGQVRVLFGPGPAPGSVVDLATQSDVRFYGEATLYRSGGVVPMPFQQRAVAGLDWNGDGRDEIVMSAVQGDPGGRSDAGIVYVYYGAPRESLPAQVSLGSASVVNLYGEGAGDWAGLCMAGADFDLDGREDLVITAPRADGPQNRTNCGAVFVVMGRPRAQTPLVWELATDADRRFIGEDDGDLTGIYALPGDVDGDTVPDLLFCGCGAMGPNNSIPIAGEAYLAYSASPLPAPPPAPAALRLRLAGGHPAAGAVALVLEMPRAGEARVEVFDLQGRRVARLAEGTFGAGAHPLRWEGAEPPGVYLIVARTALGSASARAVVLK